MQQDAAPVRAGRAEELAVNMIRHEYANYDDLLIDCPKSDKRRINRQSCDIIKVLVHDHIVPQLPELAAASSGPTGLSARYFPDQANLNPR